MQYVFFEKKVYTVYNGVWLLSTISYGKKIGGAGCTSCSPNNFVEGATAPPIPTSMLIMHLKTSEKNYRKFSYKSFITVTSIYKLAIYSFLIIPAQSDACIESSVRY